MKKGLHFFIVALLLVLTNTAKTQQTDVVPGEILVQLNPGINSESFLKKLNHVLDTEVESIECVSDLMNIYTIRFVDPNTNLDEILRSFNSSPSVFPEIKTAQKNHYVFDRETIPSDTLFDNQWHHKNTGQTGGIVDADIDSPEAWDITSGGLTTHGDTIVVCIIESNGVDINHIDLKDNIWKNYAEIPDDGIDNDNNGYVDDFNGWHVINLDDAIGAGSHGTRVSGMIGASGNNITGVSGVNWKVKMMVVQGQQASNEATVIAAYTYPLKMRKRYNETNGAQGAFVVATNSSWGIDGGSAADSPLWCAMYDSLGYFGILNIAATTNSDNNVDVVGDMPTTCVSEFLVGVTMTNSQDLRAGSGYGVTHVDLGAPGQAVQTTMPGSYSVSSGTSFATPCVTGCVALAYSSPCAEFINFVKYNPQAATLDMRHYLLSSVDPNAGLASEVASGGRANVKNFIDSILADCSSSSCISPYNIVISDLTDTSAQISWSGFSADHVVYLQQGSGGLNPIDATGTNTLEIDTLLPCTWYTVYVQTNCGADSSVLSFPVTFQTDGCCNNPQLEVATKTENSMTIIWDDVLYATSYSLRYKLSSDVSWTEMIDVSAPYLIGSLSACTDYDFQIKTQCADSTHGYGNTQTFTTMGCGACTEKVYCDVSGGNSDQEWIQAIAINGFSNATGDNNGWLQSNQIITALTPGASYVISFTPGYSGFNFTEGFSVWIDLNHDGIFGTGENLINNLTSNTSISGMLNIPGTAEIGVTRMRIGMNATDAPEICPISAFYGEYEDYCVYLGPQTGYDELTIERISLYPNPAMETVFIQSDQAIQQVEVFDLAGNLIPASFTKTENQLHLHELSSGIYLVRVYTANGTTVLRLVKN